MEKNQNIDVRILRIQRLKRREMGFLAGVRMCVRVFDFQRFKPR